MTNLVLVRHGETIWHAEKRYAGSSDVSLTSRGYKQAELLADWARKAQLDAIWVSPLSRTRETAAQTVLAVGLAPHVDDRLRELSFGQAEGRTLEEMKNLFPEAVAAFRADPIAYYLPGGENPTDAVQRVIACFEEITSAYPKGRVLIVMHNTLIRLALCKLIDVPLSRYRVLFPSVHNCTLTEICLEGDKTSLLMYNAPILDQVVEADISI